MISTQSLKPKLFLHSPDVRHHPQPCPLVFLIPLNCSLFTQICLTNTGYNTAAYWKYGAWTWMWYFERVSRHDFKTGCGGWADSYPPASYNPTEKNNPFKNHHDFKLEENNLNIFNYMTTSQQLKKIWNCNCNDWKLHSSYHGDLEVKLFFQQHIFIIC